MQIGKHWLKADQLLNATVTNSNAHDILRGATGCAEVVQISMFILRRFALQGN